MKLFTHAAVLIALATPAGIVSAKSITPENSARHTLTHMENLARDAANHAERYSTAVKDPQLSAETKFEQLEFLREDVNLMSRDLTALEAGRATLPSWEQQAVERVQPLVQEAMLGTTAAIQTYNDTHGRALWMGSESAERTEHDANMIASTISDYLKFHDLRQHEARVTNKLAIGDR